MEGCVYGMCGVRWSKTKKKSKPFFPQINGHFFFPPPKLPKTKKKKNPKSISVTTNRGYAASSPQTLRPPRRFVHGRGRSLRDDRSAPPRRPGAAQSFLAVSREHHHCAAFQVLTAPPAARARRAVQGQPAALLPRHCHCRCRRRQTTSAAARCSRSRRRQGRPGPESPPVFDSAFFGDLGKFSRKFSGLFSAPPPAL
jgi:hypothetical protein